MLVHRGESFGWREGERERRRKKATLHPVHACSAEAKRNYHAEREVGTIFEGYDLGVHACEEPMRKKVCVSECDNLRSAGKAPPGHRQRQ
jgi:hypothetical protein